MATRIKNPDEIIFNDPFSEAFFKNSKAAITEAINDLLAKGIPVTYMKNGKTLRRYSDGRIEEISLHE